MRVCWTSLCIIADTLCCTLLADSEKTATAIYVYAGLDPYAPEPVTLPTYPTLQRDLTLGDEPADPGAKEGVQVVRATLHVSRAASIAAHTFSL